MATFKFTNVNRRQWVTEDVIGTKSQGIDSMMELTAFYIAMQWINVFYCCREMDSSNLADIEELCVFKLPLWELSFIIDEHLI